eukprot:scaffold344_cov130-Cylindrotheca_fusiformis.AAC.14
MDCYWATKWTGNTSQRQSQLQSCAKIISSCIDPPQLLPRRTLRLKPTFVFHPEGDPPSAPGLHNTC